MRVSLFTVGICLSTTLANPILQGREERSSPSQQGKIGPSDKSIPNEVGQSGDPGQARMERSWTYEEIVDAWLKCYDHCLEKSTDAEGRINARKCQGRLTIMI